MSSLFACDREEGKKGKRLFSSDSEVDEGNVKSGNQDRSSDLLARRRLPGKLPGKVLSPEVLLEEQRAFTSPHLCPERADVDSHQISSGKEDQR